MRRRRKKKQCGWACDLPCRYPACRWRRVLLFKIMKPKQGIKGDTDLDDFDFDDYGEDEPEAGSEEQEDEE